MSGVPGTHYFIPLHNIIQFLEFVIGQTNDLAVLLDPGESRGAWDRDDHWEAGAPTVIPNPCQRDLADGTTLLVGDPLDLVHKLHVLLKIARLNSRERLAYIPFREVVRFYGLSSLLMKNVVS